MDHQKSITIRKHAINILNNINRLFYINTSLIFFTNENKSKYELFNSAQAFRVFHEF